MEGVFLTSECLGTGEAARAKRLHASLLAGFGLREGTTPFVLYDPARNGVAFRNAAPFVTGEEVDEPEEGEVQQAEPLTSAIAHQAESESTRLSQIHELLTTKQKAAP